MSPSYDGITVISTLALKGALEAAAPGLNAEFHATQALLPLIAAGQVADVLILTAEGIDQVEATGKLVPGSKRVLGTSSVGLAVKAGAAKPAIGTVAQLTASLLAAASVGHSAQGASGLYFAGLLGLSSKTISTNAAAQAKNGISVTTTSTAISPLDTVVKPFTVFNVDGLKVGVIGMANLSSLTSIFDQPNSVGVTPLNTVETAQFYVDLLRPMVDVVVVVSVSRVLMRRWSSCSRVSSVICTWRSSAICRSRSARAPLSAATTADEAVAAMKDDVQSGAEAMQAAKSAAAAAGLTDCAKSDAESIGSVVVLIRSEVIRLVVQHVPATLPLKQQVDEADQEAVDCRRLKLLQTSRILLQQRPA